MRSLSTVGVERGPLPTSLFTFVPRAADQTVLPSARLRQKTTLARSRDPCTKMRSPLTASEPYPSPRPDIAQICRGPGDRPCLSSTASFDTPLRSGTRHWGQSDGPLGTVLGGAEWFTASDDAWTENQMMNRAAGSASDRVSKRLRFIAVPPFFHKKLFTR